MRAIALCPGTCGELFQGWLDGVCQLVSCPIGLWSRVELSVSPGDGCIALPPSMQKTELALKIAMDMWRIGGFDVSLYRNSQLAGSRGYASSTADILASLYALAACFDLRLSEEEATEIAVSVEPSDGLAWSDLVLMDHRNFSIHRRLGPVPELILAVFDPGGEVDTVEFNKKVRPCTPSCHDRILSDLEKGLAQGDWRRFAKASTDSAMANQSVLFKGDLDLMLSSSFANGALGIVTAHSGTVSGAIFLRDHLKNRGAFFWPPELGEPFYVPMVSGGVRLLEVENDSGFKRFACSGVDRSAYRGAP